VKRTTKQGMRNNVKHAAKLLDYHNRKATEAAAELKKHSAEAKKAQGVLVSAVILAEVEGAL
jgi:hypothetical protein